MDCPAGPRRAVEAPKKDKAGGKRRKSDGTIRTRLHAGGEKLQVSRTNRVEFRTGLFAKAPVRNQM